MSAVAGHVIEQQHGRYLLSTDPARVDVAAVHRYLSESSYWARGRPFDMQVTAVANSLLVVGAYLDAGADVEQVGFARMVTDLATFAWLSDVYVLDEHQGSGLGTAMVRLIVEHPSVDGVRLAIAGHRRRSVAVRACRLRPDRRSRAVDGASPRRQCSSRTLTVQCGCACWARPRRTLPSPA